MESRNLSAALAYAAQGFPVFPVFEIEDGACSCARDCGKDAGKHPRTARGHLDATKDEATIRSWWTVWPNANVGIATGRVLPDGGFLVVVEYDGRHGGLEKLQALLTEHRTWPSTRTVDSGSRQGQHFYFRAPMPIAGFVLARGGDTGKRRSVEVKASGGYVLAPPSNHASGNTYEQRSDCPGELAPIPMWICSFASKPRVGVAAFAPTPISESSLEWPRRVEVAREACLAMPEAIEGENGSLALWNLALYLVRTLELPIATCEALISESYNPRCKPRWDPKEIRHKLEDARDKSDRPCGLIPFEALEAAMDHVANCATPAPPSTRRQKSPAHQYTCRPGDTPNGKKTKTTLGHVQSVLRTHDDWSGVLQYDAFRDRVIAINPPVPMPGAESAGFNEHDANAIRTWFECVGSWTMSKELAWDAAHSIALENAFHPIVDYLASCPRVEGSIERMARDALGLSDPLDLVYVRKFAIAAARRAMQPGCKVDTVFTLRGDPGLKKSTFVAALFTDEWSTDSVGSIEDEKGVGERLAGKWGVELGELKSLRSAKSAETILTFTTRRVDRYRGAYARGNARDYPRSCVFIATTNDLEILRDANGADKRRFWIVEPRRIDVAWIEANRDAVWGEAYALARTSEPHWLGSEQDAIHNERMKRYEHRGQWHDAIIRFCVGREIVRVAEIWRALGGTTEKLTKANEQEIARTLRSIGCDRMQKGKLREWVWTVPTELRAADVPADEAERRAGDVLLSLAN